MQKHPRGKQKSRGKSVGNSKNHRSKNAGIPINTRVPEMRFQDEARHGRGLEGLLNRYFK